MSIGDQIRDARIRKGISQERLALLIHVSRGKVSHVRDYLAKLDQQYDDFVAISCDDGIGAFSGDVSGEINISADSGLHEIPSYTFSNNGS